MSSVTAPTTEAGFPAALQSRTFKFVLRSTVERIQRELPAELPKVQKRIADGRYLVVEEVPIV